MSENNLSIQTQPDTGGAVVTLSGEIDMRCSPALRAALLEIVERNPGRVILDLSAVSYVDSSGVGTLVEFKRKIERVNGRVVLTGMQERVKSVFEITKLDRFFAIAANLEEARKLRLTSGAIAAAVVRGPAAVGRGLRAGFAALYEAVEYVGGLTNLMGSVANRTGRSLTGRGQRVRFEAVATQCFRFGVRSIPIVMLVQLFIGVILVLNIAPTFESYGQVESVAIVIAIAIFRELGPLLTAILLSGFAGASIAAELGAMVEGEEIKALRAHALDPIRFLVAPRVLATAAMMIGLTVMADVVGILGGFLTGVYVLDISPRIFLETARSSVDHTDYLTGLFKGLVFGAIIATLACFEGLNVKGGAVGVGQATTTTVVKSIVALIGADMVFTAVFYVLGW